MKWKILLPVFVFIILATVVFNIALLQTTEPSSEKAREARNPVLDFVSRPASYIKNNIIQKENISFSSEIENVKIEPQNVESLKKFLSETGFFDENGVNLRRSNQKVTVRNLKIVLTDKKYNYNNFTSGQNGHLRSTDETFENGLLTLFVGMNKDQYFSSSSKIKNAALGLTSQILLATFSLARPEEYSRMQTLSLEEMPKEMITANESFQTNPLVEIKINN